MERLPALERACGSDRWTLTRVDVDRSENAEEVERFHVRAVPTTSLVDEHGHETLRLVGYQTEARLRDALEREVQIACAEPRSPSAAPVEQAPTCEVGGTC
jgi:thioredoxin-like negative regulator of GroEL